MTRPNAGSSGKLHTPALLHFFGRFCSEKSNPVTRKLKSQNRYNRLKSANQAHTRKRTVLWPWQVSPPSTCRPQIQQVWPAQGELERASSIKHHTLALPLRANAAAFFCSYMHDLSDGNRNLAHLEPALAYPAPPTPASH